MKLISFPEKKGKRIYLLVLYEGQYWYASEVAPGWGPRGGVGVAPPHTERLVGLLLGLLSSSGSFLRWRTVGLGTVRGAR